MFVLLLFCITLLIFFSHDNGGMADIWGEELDDIK